jgi:hypothetical protein
MGFDNHHRRDRMERRSHPRVEVSHPVLYFTDIYSRPKVGSTLDLSLGGARIETPHNLLQGERLELSIAIRPQAIKCRGKAIYVSGAEGGGVRAGIHFEALSENDTIHLRLYISHIMEKRV